MDAVFVFKDINDLCHKVFILTWVIINEEIIFIRDGYLGLISLRVHCWTPVMAPSYLSTRQRDLFHFFQPLLHF